MALTKLDWFEKLAQFAYTTQCVAMPAFWVKDNYVDQTTTPTMIALTRIIGVLCFCITMMTYVVRSSKVCQPMIAKFDIATAVAWGVCGLLTLTTKDLYKPDKFLANVGLQGVLSAAFLYQSTTRTSKKK